MDSKKRDLRSKTDGNIAAVDNKAQMAGEADRAKPLTQDSNMHELTPEIGKHLAEGQVTKSS